MGYESALELVQEALRNPAAYRNATSASQVLYACQEIARVYGRSPGFVSAAARSGALNAIKLFSPFASVQAVKMAEAAAATLGASKATLASLAALLAKGALVVLAAAVAVAAAYYGSQWLGEKLADDPVEAGPQADRVRDQDPDVKPPPRTDPQATSWYVWYADDIALKPVMVGTKEDFERVDYRDDYPGGGMAHVPMTKVPIVRDAPSRARAIELGLAQFDSIQRIPASSTFVFTDWMGMRDGQRHDIDELE